MDRCFLKRELAIVIGARARDVRVSIAARARCMMRRGNAGFYRRPTVQGEARSTGARLLERLRSRAGVLE
eukprot:1538455-Lingulodinium_polyedra.AAC.1